MKKISLYLIWRQNRGREIRGQMPQNTPSLLIHLLKCISYVKGADLLVVLELQKLVATVPCHINKDVGPLIAKESL